MASHSFVLALTAVVAMFQGISGQYSALNTCYQDDPNFRGCILAVLQTAIPYLASGAADLGLPPLDPLPVPSLSAEGRSVAVNLGVILSNALLKGLSRTVLEAAEVDPQNYRMLFKAHVNGPVEISGGYELDGRAMMIPFHGEGSTKIVINNVGVIVAIQGRPVQRNGATYMSIDTFDIKLSIGDMNIQLDNLFGGYLPIGNAVNSYANEHWREILQELLPSLEQNLGLYAKQFAAQVFDNVPYDKLFPKASYFYNIPHSRFTHY